MKKPLLCRLGWHTSTFLDGALCYAGTRCNKCLAWLKSEEGARVQSCRRHATVYGIHPPGACQLTSINPST